MQVRKPPSLSLLAEALRASTPSLTALLNIMNGAEDYVWFCDLVQTLLPAKAKAILAPAPEATQVSMFAEEFGATYFPLNEGMVDWITVYSYENEEAPSTTLRRGIPLALHGLDSDEYHFLWNGDYSLGLCALALLPKLDGAYLDEGLRVTWLEAAAAHIPQEVLERIPQEGIPLDMLDVAVSGTQFEGASHTARWICGQTGNYFLDVSSEDVDGSFGDPWEVEVINEATIQCLEASNLQDTMRQLGTWLEEDLPGRFAELLDFILPRILQAAVTTQEEASEDE